MHKKQRRKVKKGQFWVEFDQHASADAGVGNAAAINQATAFDENEKEFKKKHVEKKDFHKKKDHKKKDHKKKDFHKKKKHW